MSTRRKIIVLLGLVLTGAATTLLIGDDIKPVRGLSHADVREIRRVVYRFYAPDWSAFTQSNLRFWPTILRQRLTFHIHDITSPSIGTVTTHSDGTREESSHPVTVRFAASGIPKTTCEVQKKKGRWVIAPHIEE